MKEAAGYISRLMCQIAGQPARTSFRTTETSCVDVREKISRSRSNGVFAALAHDRRLSAHALLSAIACTCLVLTGCGGHGTTNSPSPKIGAAGGTVTEASGAKVVIPAGALTQDTPIAVSQSSAGAPALPAGITPAGPIYAFTPHGTSFVKPVTITVPFTAATVSASTVLALYKTNATQSAWEHVSGATVSGTAMSGDVTGFSFAYVAPQPPQGFPELTEKNWTLEVEEGTGDAIAGMHVLEKNSQTGGSLDHSFATGEVMALVPKEQATATGRAEVNVFSNDTGKTFYTYVQAPHTNVPFAVLPTDPHPVDGGRSILKQVYTFKVVDPKATLKFILSHSDLDLIDDGGNPLDGLMCPWLDPAKLSPDQFVAQCAPFAMSALNQISVQAFKVSSSDDLYNGFSVALVSGSVNSWDFEVVNADTVAPIWQVSDFEVDQGTPFQSAGDRITAKLKHNVAINIPLSSLLKDDLFKVEIDMSSVVSNKVQGESYAGAYLKDPVDFNAVTIEQTGLEQVPVRHDPRPEPVPVPCTTGVDPAAGQIQFHTTSYTTPERPQDVYVAVARVGGTQGQVKVLLETADGTAAAGKDYEAQHIVLRFADGAGGTRIVPVSILGDNESEQDETVNLKLSMFSGCAGLGAQSTATLTILDDDRHMHAPDSFTLGGTVSGLTGSGLVIKDLISGGTATANSNGAFTLSSRTPILDGFAYNVIVDTQPTNPDQSCTVANATGTVTGANVTNISVSCVSSVPSGSLDPTFGNAGKVTTTIPYSPGIVDAKMGMALQTDGKILMVGGTTLARFNPDGTLDSGFGSGGQVTVPFNQSGFDTAQDVAVQADGKIVVVGLTSNSLTFNDDFALARFNTDGTLDSSFGSGGKVTTDFFGSVDQARRVRIMPDGKILVAGFAVQVISSTTSVRHFALARYNTDGSLDPGFGTGGKVDEAAGASFSQARGIAIQSDGKIVVAGSGATDGVSDPDVAITRFFGDNGIRPPGTRDDTFGPTGQGFDLTNLGLSTGYEAGVDVVALADDTILVAAEVTVGPAAPPPGRNSQFTLVSFDPNDNQRRPQPAIIPITTESDRPMQMLLQSDGKTVIVGRSGDLSSNADMAIVRFTAGARSTDGTFGTNGVLTVDFFGGRDSAEAVVQQPDGKLVVGGFARVGTGIVFAMVRLMP